MEPGNRKEYDYTHCGYNAKGPRKASRSVGYPTHHKRPGNPPYLSHPKPQAGGQPRVIRPNGL